MKKLVVLFAIILVSSVFSMNWYKLVSQDGECSVEFPEEPISKVDKNLNDYKKIIHYFYKLVNRNTDYYLNIYFLTSEPKDIGSFLKDKINGILTESSGTKKDFLELNIDEILGYEMDIELNNKFSMRVRVFYYNKKYYELIVKMPTDRINTSDINMFMNSFKINVK